MAVQNETKEALFYLLCKNLYFGEKCVQIGAKRLSIYGYQVCLVSIAHNLLDLKGPIFHWTL